MKVTLESTSRFVEINGLPARIWEGRTEKGVEVFAAITRIGAHKDADFAEFDRDLMEARPPSPGSFLVFPLRLVL